VIRREAATRDPQQDAVWQPRFAYAAAAVLLVVFALVTAPLWLVFYRISGPESNNGAGPEVADLVGLSMMLMGGLLTVVAAWVIIVEMRGRVRMVDRLARTSERETVVITTAPAIEPAAGSADPSAAEESVEEPVDPVDAPTDVITFVPPPQPLVAQVVSPAAPQSAAATLEASSKLLQSFSRVLRAFSQLPAQVAMLAVALALFVGATVLTLR
jgi:hypothetical protein